MTGILKKKTKFIENKLDLVWLILFPILNVNYMIAGKIHEQGLDISLNIDKTIKLIPSFVLPYVYWYPFMVIGLLMFLKQSRQLYLKVFITLVIGMCTSYIFYYLLPTEYPRAAVTGDGFFNWLIGIVYSNDRPFNCFPSLHVYGTYLIMRFTSYKKNRWYFIYTQIVGILIILSTVFIKQHFVLDILGSVILFEILKFLSKFLNETIIERLLALPSRVISLITNKKEENQSTTL